jgi:hypothetical protein
MRCVALFCALSSLAAVAGPPAVPPVLEPWRGWVLHDSPQLACPFLHGTEQRHCAWPGRLTLQLDEKGGRFSQSFAVFQEGWLRLPGHDRRWPQAVTVDGKPAVVVASDDGWPTVLLAPGEHQVSGDFGWDQLPEALEIPPDTGVLTLTIKGQIIAIPNRDAEGRVFFQREAASEETDRVELDVHRLVIDDIPLVLTTRITFKISGRSREMSLGRVLPDGFTPLALTSPLPVRIEADGSLRLQARPGTWQVELSARGAGPLTTLKRPVPGGLWLDGDELWAFEARPSLRQVLVEGVAAVDPSQTTLPAEWRQFPTFTVGQNDEIRLSERRRGDSDPAPDVLNLSRTVWLDFAGTGFTISDNITGQLHRSWRLDVQPGTALGRVVTSGADQSITRLPAGNAGVELRQGGLQLEADSRVDGDISRLSAVSWDADFNSVTTTLQLPPGWTLFAASGADGVPGTWVQKWTLLDLFLVLIISVGFARLFGWPIGTLALVTLALSWLETDSPRYVWLSVLACEALLRVIPQGSFRTLFKLTRLGSWAALAVLTFGFAVYQVRTSMYPSLAKEEQLGGVKTYSDYSSENQAQYDRSNSFGEGNIDGNAGNAGFFDSLSRNSAPRQQQVQSKEGWGKKRSFNVKDYDKNATVQTGPGRPRWEWKNLSIRFSGPVQRGQQLRFFFINPAMNLVLAFMRVLLLALLVLVAIGFPGSFWPQALKRLTSITPLLLAAACTSLLVSRPASAQVPPPEMLEQLKERLLQPPECAPSCASSPRLTMEASTSTLRLRLEVLAGAPTAVPLPGDAQQWSPTTVLLDGKPASGLRRESDGRLWLAVGTGAHQVLLEGPLPARNTVQIALPLRSHRVEAKVDGWALDGLHEDGVADDALQLTQKTRGEGERASLQMGTLPPFVRVERTLVLGLTWTVETTVQRVTGVGTAVVLEVPLLPGESVTSSDVRVQAGKALVNMPASETQVSWSSALETRAPLSLTAPNEVPWVEVWRVDVSPVWHAQFSGIPVVHQQDASGLRMPEWRPWPGETITIEVLRPEPLTGQTLTIDQSSLTVTAGARATDVRFAANFRSSRGGLHPFTLPANAALQSVIINGAQQPIRQQGHVVSIPLVPGSQSVELNWRESAGIVAQWRSPALNVGTPTVNATIEVKVPRDRWVLWVRGPGVGPAVLFWSFILVLLVVSVALGRSRATPLKAHQWALLALGLSQVPVVGVAFLFGWLLFVAWRQRYTSLTDGWFNLRQLIFVGATLGALLVLAAGVYKGLLGSPDMQVRGNGSTASLLRWFQDRTDAAYPVASVLSAPMLVYRGAMLAWSLWMAFSLLSWLKWAWQAFSAGGLWRKAPHKTPMPPPTSGGSAAP